MRANTILETIGSTPHVRIHRLFGATHEVWMKLERANPGGSINDRIALAMIEDAEARGLLQKGSVVVEATSGNTGIGLAMVCAVKGYSLIVVMPDSMTVERRRVMAAYGAKFELTARADGMNGAIARARQLVSTIPHAWMPKQFENEANTEVHRRTTAEEILADFPEGFDVLISAVATGGHLTACCEALKPKWPKLKIFAVEPAQSPVLSGGAPGPHLIQGMGPGFIPKNLKPELLDGVITVDHENAYEMARRAAKEEGIFLGLSSGAALDAVRQKLLELPNGSRVLTFCYDTGERYLSIENLF